MAICKSCGVDLGEKNEKCPLCESQDSTKIISPADVLYLSRSENKRQLYELTMVLLFSAALMILAIDAASGKGMSWSFIAFICIGYVAAVITVFTFLLRHRFLLLGSLMVLTALFLFFINMLTGNQTWFRMIALPVSVSFFILTGLVLFLNSLSRYRGLNSVGTMLLGLAFFLVTTEYFTDRFISGSFRPQWSIVAAASLTVIALILGFIHYRLKRGQSLGGLFHV